MSAEGFKVAARRCGECLFGPRKVVGDARRDAILAKVDADASHFVCHRASMRRDVVVCAGYAESIARGERLSRSLTLARALDVVVLVDPETGAPARGAP